MATNRELLEKAGDVLREGGWKQGGLGSIPSEGGSHCLAGCIYRAAYLLDHDNITAHDRWTMSPSFEASMKPAFGLVEEVIREKTNQYCSSVTGWNDVLANSQDDVLDVLTQATKKAIAYEESES